jgi:YjbE family integral membrane protein
MDWQFVVGFLQIVVIDLALSADNAIVIGMAAASLPRNQRSRAIIIGGGLAIVLRIALTTGVSFLIRIPYLSAVAGAVLFWVAWKLLNMNIGEVDDPRKIKTKPAETFRQAITLIIIADFTMSLDNILAIAGASHGSYILLIIGLLISMPLLMTTGSFISRLIDKFKWIPFLGAAVISFTGIRMILEDQSIHQYLMFQEWQTLTIAGIGGLLFAFIVFMYNRYKVARAQRKLETARSQNCKPNE